MSIYLYLTDEAIVALLPSNLLTDTTTYPTPIATLQITVDGSPDPNDNFSPLRVNITKRVTVIGRNKQKLERMDFPIGVDVDLSIFEHLSRTVSHIHAVIVYNPTPSTEKKVKDQVCFFLIHLFFFFFLLILGVQPSDFVIWLVGRNYTKINGVPHRVGMVPLKSTSILGISKLRVVFKAVSNS